MESATPEAPGPTTPQEEPAIRVEDLSVAYGDHRVLDHVGFEVARGEIFVILGGSGCGKSTLLKHMIGLHRPRTGEVYLEGREIHSADPTERLEILRRIGVSYQNGALFGSMSVLENVMLPLEEFTDLPPEARAMVARMKLQLVGLDGFGNHSPSELSGGMRKRAAIARAMALDPAILFLDEPSAGLDPITSAELDELILQLSKTLGVTFVIVTHELDSIFRIATRVIVLDKSIRGILTSGDPRILKDESPIPAVRAFFHRDPSLAQDLPAIEGKP